MNTSARIHLHEYVINLSGLSDDKLPKGEFVHFRHPDDIFKEALDTINNYPVYVPTLALNSIEKIILLTHHQILSAALDILSNHVSGGGGNKQLLLQILNDRGYGKFVYIGDMYDKQFALQLQQRILDMGFIPVYPFKTTKHLESVVVLSQITETHPVVC